MRCLLIAVAWMVAGAAPPPGAANCSGCHDAGSGMPALAGRDAAGLAAVMIAYRSGALPSTMMGRLMKGLTPEEITAIAQWEASQK